MPELRPAAKSAGVQIQELQKALPLAQFAAYQPGGVAGLSPLQQFTLNGLLPGTLNAPQGFQPLLDLPGSVGPAAFGAMLAGEPTAGSQYALQTLAPRLYAPTGGTPSIQNTSSPFLSFLALANLLASQQGSRTAAATPSAFPSLLPSSAAPAAPMTVPVIGGPDVDVTQGMITAPTAPSPAAGTPAPVVNSQGFRLATAQELAQAIDEADHLFPTGTYQREYVQRWLANRKLFADDSSLPPVGAPRMRLQGTGGTGTQPLTMDEYFQTLEHRPQNVAHGHEGWEFVPLPHPNPFA